MREHHPQCKLHSICRNNVFWRPNIRSLGGRKGSRLTKTVATKLEKGLPNPYADTTDTNNMALSELISSGSDADKGLPEPYRLYKWRWVGVFAMVRSFFFPVVYSEFQIWWVVYARSCSRRHLSLVRPHIQQRCKV